MASEKDVIVKIERSDGKQFVIDCTDYVIPSDGLSGLDTATWDIYTQPLAFRAGAIVTGKNYSGRNIEIEFYTVSTDDLAVRRNLIRQFFNPRFNFTLYITYQGVTRWIEGVRDGFSLPSENTYKKLECKVGFFCEDPFFRNMDYFYKDLQTVEPRWHFPFVSTVDNPSVFSIFSFGKYIWFDNDGDEETQFTAILYFTDEVVDPVIYQGFQDANKFFKLKGTFTENDIVIIDFDYKVLTLNGEFAWNLMDKDSDLLSIPVGGEYLSCTAASGSSCLHCVVSYYKKYGGM